MVRLVVEGSAVAVGYPGGNLGVADGYDFRCHRRWRASWRL